MGKKALLPKLPPLKTYQKKRDTFFCLVVETITGNPFVLAK